MNIEPAAFTHHMLPQHHFIGGFPVSQLPATPVFLLPLAPTRLHFQVHDLSVVKVQARQRAGQLPNVVYVRRRLPSSCNAAGHCLGDSTLLSSSTESKAHTLHHEQHHQTQGPNITPSANSQENCILVLLNSMHGLIRLAAAHTYSSC